VDMYMRIRMAISRKLALVVACTCLVPLASQALSITVTLSDAFGYIKPGTATSTADNQAYINTLVDIAEGSLPNNYQPGGVGTDLYVMQNAGASVGDALLPSDNGGIGGDNIVTTTGYEYLIVKYDGDQGYAYVWNVVGADSVTVPAEDPLGNKNNKYLLFNAAPPTGVPDGGLTVILLGIGTMVLGGVRRFVRK
jgi:hypothetical protein